MKSTLGLGCSIALLAPLLPACGGGSDTSEELPPLFEPKPECQGAAITPYAGTPQVIISKLEIATRPEGFDLDGDGEPDNKLAGVANIARSALADALDEYDLMIPLEFFDLPALAEDSCVKFGVYLGEYKHDDDDDGATSTVSGGDCDDGSNARSPFAAEIPGNFIDDDCDGLADEDGGGVLPNDTADRDGDGVTIAQGDCDDTAATGASANPGLAETCNDGIDNDCDGVADRGVDGANALECNPFDATPDTIDVIDLSFGSSGAPLIAFTSGEIVNTPSGFQLNAGPSLFQVSIPITAGLVLDLRITGATIEAKMASGPNGIYLASARLGGVIDAHTADTVRGLEIPEIMLTAQNSLADATFANVLGTLLALPKVTVGTYTECRSPDIDVDRDGIEIFCDTVTSDENKQVDLCIDGDGSQVFDEKDANGVVTRHCTDVTDAEGKLRFVDGISVGLKFETANTVLD